MKMKIGFIGQGFVGKNYADDFEVRGHEVVRYAQEKPYDKNKLAIKTCDLVFIAVPTPTTPKGFDLSIIKSVIPLTKAGAIVVLKSTIPPGETEKLQKKFADRIIMHSPEFLSEATASHDAAHPFMNIIGITKDNAEHRRSAELVLSVLPTAPHSAIVTSIEAEIIKYSHNCAGFANIIFMNLMFTLADSLGADWEKIKPALKADPFIASYYTSPVHKSGRGAGGACFIKDFKALKQIYSEQIDDILGKKVLESLEKKNIELLRNSGKSLDILKKVYGK